jgi:hypothetical protein
VTVSYVFGIGTSTEDCEIGKSVGFLSCSSLVVETRSHYVAQAGLELSILLPP